MLKIIEKIIKKISDKVSGNGLMQEFNVAEGERYVTEGMPEIARKSGAEGIVLLKNDGVLPLNSNDKIAIFGRCQHDYFCVGYGSGGDVKPPYKVNLLQAMREKDAEGKFILDQVLADTYEQWCKENVPFEGWWGHWPMNYPEMPLDDALIEKTAKDSDIAIVVIGRAAGEDRENILKKGSYYLTDEEEVLLDKITQKFSKTIVIMNCGNVVDMSWTIKYGDRLSAILYAWQSGMESGHSVADVLCGDVNPCGKLPDTIAINYEDYPSADCFGAKEFNEYREDIFVGYRYFETFAKDKVLYPFGYGLSYTQFEIKPVSFSVSEDIVKCSAEVKNVGNLDGKEVVQVYVKAPQGVLGKAERSLVAFKKTNLLKAGESQTLDFEFDCYTFASFDDTGATGNKHSYVLEEGEYKFFVGSSVRADDCIGRLHLPTVKVIKTLKSVCAVQYTFQRIHAVEKDSQVIVAKESVPLGDVDLAERILDNLPKEIGYKGNQGHKFDDVRDGKIDMDTFISQLTDVELEALTRGIGYMRVAVEPLGNAGAYGGVIPSLKEKGVPMIITADGPAGIRISKFTSLLPCGTALASTWDIHLVEQLYTLVGKEMAHYGADVLLGAGMNIHRNPLCGRNFEYFSEDPILSGKMASAFVNGVQSSGKGACPKHFACNNQEFNRNYNDSRISERALREIYLKGFEICVADSNPLNIMTSYNKINGVWNHYNYDLATTVLRGEWNYDGLVITDWWMRRSKSPEFPKIQDNAYRVRAQVDVFMPGDNKFTAKKYKSDGTLLPTLGKQGGITRAELERTAKNTLSLALRIEK